MIMAMKAAPIRMLSTIMSMVDRGKVFSTVLLKPSITPLLSAPEQTRKRETKKLSNDCILTDHNISHKYSTQSSTMQVCSIPCIIYVDCPSSSLVSLYMTIAGNICMLDCFPTKQRGCYVYTCTGTRGIWRTHTTSGIAVLRMLHCPIIILCKVG